MDIRDYLKRARSSSESEAESTKRRRDDGSELADGEVVAGSQVDASSGAAAGGGGAGAARGDGKHVVGYNSKWEEEFPWLIPKRNEAGVVTGMFCSWCVRHKTKNKQNHAAVWNVTPCVCIRKDSVRRHSLSLQHKEATEKEQSREGSSRDGGIEQAFQKQLSLNKGAIKIAMECLYWLVKAEVPHMSLYASMLEAVKFMGCDKLNHLHHGENAKYTSHRITEEFFQVLGDQIETVELENLLKSSFYSIMIDESTDISVINEMVIYGRYIDSSAIVKTSFLKIVQLTNGTADTIEEALLGFLSDKSIPLSRLVGFGSDGASVMTGCVSGVATRLKHKQPILTSIHCVAHRLALAAGQAGDKVPYIANTFKSTLRQLFHFYENSSVRMSGLKAIEQILELPEIKLKKAADTRWLSHDNACKTLVKVLPAVIASLEREATERGDALAVGLSRVVKHYNFVASLYMMCDVLPKVSRLSRIFQFSTIDMSSLHKYVTTAVEALKLLVHTDGEYVKVG